MYGNQLRYLWLLGSRRIELVRCGGGFTWSG